MFGSVLNTSLQITHRKTWQWNPFFGLNIIYQPIIIFTLKIKINEETCNLSSHSRIDQSLKYHLGLCIDFTVDLVSVEWLLTEAHSEPSRTLNMEPFVKLVTDWNSLINFFNFCLTEFWIRFWLWFCVKIAWS